MGAGNRHRRDIDIANVLREAIANVLEWARRPAWEEHRDRLFEHVLDLVAVERDLLRDGKPMKVFEQAGTETL